MGKKKYQLPTGQQQYNQPVNGASAQVLPKQASALYHQQQQQPQIQEQPMTACQQYAPYPQQADSYAQQDVQNQQPQAQLYAPQPAHSYAQQYGQAINQNTNTTQQTSSTTVTTVKEEVIKYEKEKKPKFQQPVVTQAPVPQPVSIDYDSLLTSSQIQDAIDYDSLLIPSETQTPVPQPAPIDYDSLKVPAKSQQVGTSTDVTTQTTTTTQEVGGRSRQAAAAKGDAELRKFDKRVNDMLMAGSQMCIQGFGYYCGPQGYLCGGGSHLVSHDEVDAMLAGRRPFGVNVELVNGPWRRFIPPPAEGWHEPMHWSPAQRILGRLRPLAMKHDGTPWQPWE